MLPNKEFMDKVEMLRNMVSFSLPVTSAARCAKHNASVSSTGSTGPHTTGRAIDLQVSRENAYIVLKMALETNLFTGIGIQQKGGARFIHLDDLTGVGRPTVWSY
jgi:uncharacterized protein YcbK (DUF882 family)